METQAMTTDTTLTGRTAIDYARANGLRLRKYADPTEGARDDLTVEEAEAVAREDARLIWIHSTETLTKTCGSIAVWAPTLLPGAPSNASGMRNSGALYRTKAEALEHKHWGNQAAWADVVEVTIFDEINDPGITTENEERCWDAIGWIEDYLPPSDAGREVLTLARQRLFAQSVERMLQHQESGVALVRP